MQQKGKNKVPIKNLVREEQEQIREMLLTTDSSTILQGQSEHDYSGVKERDVPHMIRSKYHSYNKQSNQVHSLQNFLPKHATPRWCQNLLMVPS